MSDMNKKRPTLVPPTVEGQMVMTRERLAGLDLEDTADFYNCLADVRGLPRVDRFADNQAAKAALSRLLARLEELAAEDAESAE